jgi:DICT domain-containing protein/nitrogen-specific signal transduction histidine kinase
MDDSNSLLQALLQSLPQLKAQIYFKATLTAISHAIEDLVLAGADRPLVIANFQQERYYRQEAGRYQRIAQCTDQVYVLAAPDTNFASAPADYPTIGIDPTDSLAQEWHLVIVGAQYSACLVCREFAAPIDAIELDSARQFRGFWTFDPAISRQAALFLFRQIRRYRPDLASKLKQAKRHYQLETLTGSQTNHGTSLDLEARLFSDRLVTYLQASQYKQIKAYRRLVVQARQEQIVNQVAVSIRQSLDPETVLSVILQEVGQLFGDCRSLIYRLSPVEVSPNQSTEQEMSFWIEYEMEHPQLPSLRGQPWQLATHPQFQAILAQGNLVAIADINQDTGIQADRDLQAQLEQAQIQACLLVPIYYQQHCLAVLELHRADPHLWSVAERELLSAIAIPVGVALIQAEAYVKLQHVNQQLTAIKQTQNNLIAIVGHEVRTPLSTILVCLESLMTEPEMPAEFRQPMVELALADSERLRRLTQDFLLLSRLESDLITYRAEPTNIADLISMAVSHLQAIGQPRALPDIRIEIPTNLPMAIADGEAVFQLLSRLLDNACKFTPPIGTITLTVRAVNIPVNPGRTKPMLEVKIADTGCGIEPNQLEMVFENFRQEENFMQRSEGGAGLGLAICRQLVRQLGGQIWATSAGKQRGSQFFMTFPALQ